MQPAVGDPALAGELDHRGPFQPPSFCDSAINNMYALHELYSLHISHLTVLMKSYWMTIATIIQNVCQLFHLLSSR